MKSLLILLNTLVLVVMLTVGVASATPAPTVTPHVEQLCSDDGIRFEWSLESDQLAVVTALSGDWELELVVNTHLGGVEHVGSTSWPLSFIHNNEVLYEHVFEYVPCGFDDPPKDEINVTATFEQLCVEEGIYFDWTVTSDAPVTVDFRSGDFEHLLDVNGVEYGFERTPTDKWEISFVYNDVVLAEAILLECTEDSAEPVTAVDETDAYVSRTDSIASSHSDSLGDDDIVKPAVVHAGGGSESGSVFWPAIWALWALVIVVLLLSLRH